MSYSEVINRGLKYRRPMKNFATVYIFCIVVAFVTACGRNEPKQPDLEKQPDRWVESVTIDSDSKAQYVGKTKDYVITTISSVDEVDGLRAINVGDEIEGIRIDAIKCSFFWKDAYHGGEQYMWRGRWGCQAGRSKQEIENSIGDKGEKYFDYIYAGPVYLEGE